MSRISVIPAELEAAAGLLASTRGVVRAAAAGGGSLGTGSLESALAGLTEALDAAARGLDEAVAAAAGNATAAARAYSETDAGAMPERG